MQNKILKILTIITVIFTALPVMAEGTSAPETSALTVPRVIAAEECTKMFGMNKENLLLLTLGAAGANNFTVEEIQTECGYVIFSAARNKYLATVAGIDDSNSILKITPCNNIYYFQPGIIVNMFKFVELNRNSGK